MKRHVNYFTQKDRMSGIKDLLLLLINENMNE